MREPSLRLAAWLAMSALSLAPSALANDSESGRQTPTSASPELDAAAGDLASGRLEPARAGFQRVAADNAQPPFVRALARWGLAETLVASGDERAADSEWERLERDPSIPRAFRRWATDRRAAVRRASEGLPAYDPAAQRVTLAPIPKPAVTFHVAPGGEDGGDGSASRPLRSLRAARDAVRRWRRSSAGESADGSVQIVVHGGVYTAESTLELEREDSGTPTSPVVYASAPGEEAVFQGGVAITSWRPLPDRGARERLHPSVRARVVRADVRALGVTDLGDATRIRQRPELFLGGAPQTLARWPNQGFVKTGDILGKDTFKVWDRIDGCKDGKFRFVEDRPTHWVDEPDVHLYGYWFWDWFEEYQRVEAIDPEARCFTLARPYSRYGYRKDQRYFAVNVLRELDSPGEWYLDRRDGMLYWLPPPGTDLSSARTVLSVFARPFLTLDDVEHVVIRGLTFQESRGDGVHIRGGGDTLVAGCTFRRLGGDAIVTRGGRHHGIFGCTMHTLGCGGANVTGGDRATLTPGEHFVENCTVYDISRLKRTYTPAVRLDGCGNRVAHNLFERMPSSAMRVEGNEQLIELNVIRHVVQESDDQGGVDMYGNPLYRGVVIRWNRWSDIGGGTHCGGAGVRLDDMISGVAVHGNLFERCGAVIFGGLQIHGGKENLVDGNVFVDCFAGISFSRWSESRWRESIARFKERARSPVYRRAYPSLDRLDDDPNVNFICRNAFVRCGPTLLRDGEVQKAVLNAVSDRPLAVNRLADATWIRGEPALRRILLAPLPVDDMGPYDHPWRAAAAADAP